MAVVNATLLTYDQAGQREDLIEGIFNISPFEASRLPFSSTIAKVSATAVVHEWQTDTLRAAAANAAIEGDDASFSSAAVTTQLTNTCQISDENVIVSKTMDAVSTAGRNREMLYQLQKRARELKRDREFVLTNNAVPVATGASATARVMRPLVNWYSTNIDNFSGSTATAGNSTNARLDGSTTSPYTEDRLKNVIRLTWTAGGEPDTVMHGPFNKQVASTFPGNAQRTDRSEDSRVIASTSLYESDYGVLKFIANSFQRERDVHVLDTSMYALAELRPMRSEDLAKTGDATKGLIVTEYTLESRNEAGSGLVSDCSTA